jgi:hypothetical protein
MKSLKHSAWFFFGYFLVLLNAVVYMFFTPDPTLHDVLRAMMGTAIGLGLMLVGMDDRLK